MQDALRERFGIEVPIIPWPQPPRRLLRISALLYNTAADYDHLVGTLPELFF